MVFIFLFTNNAHAQILVSTIGCESDKLWTDDLEILFKIPVYQSSFSDSVFHYKKIYGKHKDMPPELEDAILLALTFYPELASDRVVFKFKQIRQTMNARPSLLNMVRPPEKRKYHILINSDKKKRNGFEIEDFSFNMLTGWIGHELSHVVIYEKMTNLQIVEFSIKYILSQNYRKKVERYTDYVTIEHGLAFQLFDGVDFLLKHNDVPMDYKELISRNYLSLDEIKCFWRILNFSNLTSTE